MRLISFDVTNFGSYQGLSLNLESPGLHLIHGATGSGKSTILDIPCWILYGKTAKDGNVDEVRSWTEPDNATTGVLVCRVGNEELKITRSRGKATQNDLFWECEGALYRGKDITETQKLLSQKLGVDYDTYVISSYFHEFSPTGNFFTSKAKEQREIFEKIVDLSFPTKLSNACTVNKKVTKQDCQDNRQVLSELIGRLKQVEDTQHSMKKASLAWEEAQQRVIYDLEVKAKNFAHDKKGKEDQVILKIQRFEESRSNKVETLTRLLAQGQDLIESEDDIDTQISAIMSQHTNCVECGQPLKAHNDRIQDLRVRKIRNTQRLSELKNYHKELAFETNKENPYVPQLTQIRDSDNTYEAQVLVEKSKENPFKYQIAHGKQKLMALQAEIPKIEAILQTLESRLSQLSYLYDLSFTLRGVILANVVKEIEISTNSILEEFFDSLLKVEFSIVEDTFTIGIRKNGYPCVYRQLSKGQRQLLKLAFSISIMKSASQRSGTHFDNLFFDESLDGLDNDLKVSAFSLFQQLELDHNSILLIDHEPQFQTMFDNKYEVRMIGDISEVSAIE